MVHNGYYRVHLRKDGKSKHYRINRLMLMTFDPVEDMDKLEANHINECITDNRLENLC